MTNIRKKILNLIANDAELNYTTTNAMIKLISDFEDPQLFIVDCFALIIHISYLWMYTIKE